MNDYTELATRYLAVWNEPDAEKRRAAGVAHPADGGLSVSGLHIHVGNAKIGPFGISNLDIAYDENQDSWSGGAKVSLPSRFECQSCSE